MNYIYLNKELRKVADGLLPSHHAGNMRKIHTGNGCGKSHIVHINQGSNRVYRHRRCPADNSQDNLIRFPEDLVNQGHSKNAQSQFLEL